MRMHGAFSATAERLVVSSVTYLLLRDVSRCLHGGGYFKRRCLKSVIIPGASKSIIAKTLWQRGD